MLLDSTRLQEVLDLLGEDGPATVGRWIARLEADFGRLNALLATPDAADHPPEIAQMTDMAAMAHALKGACQAVGAEALASLCAELETNAKGGQLPDARRLLAESQTLCAASMLALRETITNR